MRANDGAWIGWPGGTETDRSRSTTTASARPVSLTAEEIESYYEGFSNDTLWPLYHDVMAKPEFHREWWDSYVAVNQRFAETPPTGPRKNATVWVHDYQLQLVPEMLRELRPDLHIGFFLHIPFPPASCSAAALAAADHRGPARRRPGRLPAARRRQNFVRLVRQRVGHDPRDLVDLPDGRTVRAAAFPISIDVAGFDELARKPEVAARGQGDPRRARQPAEDRARRRPARLHQGHRRPAARVRRAARRRQARRRGRRLRPGGDAVARARRAVPRPARRDRPAGRPHQRRLRQDRHARRSPTSTRRTRARRWPRSTGPPTSWSSRPTATA